MIKESIYQDGLTMCLHRITELHESAREEMNKYQLQLKILKLVKR